VIQDINLNFFKEEYQKRFLEALEPHWFRALILYVIPGERFELDCGNRLFALLLSSDKVFFSP